MSITNKWIVDFNLNQIETICGEILKSFGSIKIFLFYGDMGAGKTTLVKGLCAQLGVKDTVTSPTFSIVNEYRAVSGIVYHFDFYRLKNQAEALDLGYEEYFYSGDYCFIEWPEMIPDLLPDHFVRIHLSVIDEQTRSASVEKI